MKKKICKIVISLYALLFAANSPALCQEWQELKSEHFIICFTQDEGFAKEVSYKAEGYYQRIAAELGYARYSNFWTWDKRVKIYIHPDRQAFLKATAQPDWSEGMADYTNKQIISYAWSTGFVESLLPHEMAHLIFRDFVGFKGEVPLWLDEGVAQWEEEQKRNEYRQMIKKFLKEDTLLSLADMMKLDIRNIQANNAMYIKLQSARKKEGERVLLLLGGENLVNIYYLQSVSLVGFLIEKYGSTSFIEFCRQLRDGKSMEEALKFAYPTYIRSLDELEERWVNYLQEGA